MTRLFRIIKGLPFSKGEACRFSQGLPFPKGEAPPWAVVGIVDYIPIPIRHGYAVPPSPSRGRGRLSVQRPEEE